MDSSQKTWYTLRRLSRASRRCMPHQRPDRLGSRHTREALIPNAGNAHLLSARCAPEKRSSRMPVRLISSHSVRCSAGGSARKAAYTARWYSGCCACSRNQVDAQDTTRLMTSHQIHSQSRMNIHDDPLLCGMLNVYLQHGRKWAPPSMLHRYEE